MDPINYNLNPTNPMQAFNESLQLGNTVMQARANAAMAQAKIAAQEAEAQRQAQLSGLYDKVMQPGATAQDFLNLSVMLPAEQSKALGEAYKTKTEAERKADISDTSQVFSALRVGRNDIAADLLRKQAQAERAAGNEQGAQFGETLAKMIDEGGAKNVETMLGYSIASMDKDALDSILKFQESPLNLRAKEASIAQAGAELGLTNEQTKETIARTKKLEAEIALMDLKFKAAKENGKALEPAEVFDMEKKLRDEYNKRVTRYTDAQTAYDAIKVSAADNSGAGDLALVTSFMKMLDPGSVVRETEFANAQDTAGLLDKLKAVGTKIESGKFLSESQRKSFAGLAGEYMKAASGYEKQVRKDMTGIVKDWGINENNVFGESRIEMGLPADEGKQAPKGAAKPAQAPAAPGSLVAPPVRMPVVTPNGNETVEVD